MGWALGEEGEGGAHWSFASAASSIERSSSPFAAATKFTCLYASGTSFIFDISCKATPRLYRMLRSVGPGW